MLSARENTPTALQPNDDAARVAIMCDSQALFMARASLPALFLVIFLVTPLAAGCVVWLVKLANPKLSDPIETVALPEEGEHTPATPPPAYHEHRRSTDDPSSYADVHWSVRESSEAFDPEGDAEKFVTGTAVLGVLVFLLVVIALSIQSLTWCTRTPAWLTIVLWTIYGGLTLASVHGLGAYLLLFRNLWGKRGRETFAVKDTFLVEWTGMVVVGPFVMLFVLASDGVKRCQRSLCGQTDEEEDVELGVTPSTPRFPPAARATFDDAKSEEDSNKHVDDEPLDNNTAETRGLLSGQEGASSSS